MVIVFPWQKQTPSNEEQVSRSASQDTKLLKLTLY